MERVKQVVHAKEVYKKGYSGKGIRIALLDTGVFQHENLEGNIIYFKDYINHRKECYDDNGHGTHIAGILCGHSSHNEKRFFGMAPNAELLVFKILDKNGSGSTDTAINALDWIKHNHRRYNIKLLNFSMGYLPNTNPKMQERLIERLESLWEEGVTIITAAGNNGPEENSISVPGISRKVITVGSSDDIFLENERLRYGGRGPTSCCIVKPEILAPGTDILSLSINPNGFSKKSGTSMSVPIVCGALALSLEKSPQLKPVEIKLLLYDTVDPVSSKNINAWGILNVDNLMKML
ncbi:MAG: S8 family peptidase [Agathobacter sp.]|nr:S8 family peptidase [Agathobacter sp.]